MNSMDQNMPFLLRYENVAWYEKGQVRILDRRVYPTQVSFVVCNRHEEVAQAIADMVTQSAGPYTAVAMGMALAAFEVTGRSVAAQIAHLEQASHTLSHARPTTANRYRKITDNCVLVAKNALLSVKNPVDAIVETALASLNRRYGTMQIVGDHLASLLPDGGTLLTQCYGETIIGTLIRAAAQQNKTLRVFCAETRPYFQGARLTASCFAQMGWDTTVITDNMVADLLSREQVDAFTSAADTMTRDGHIANKIGTLQMAILSKYFAVPYYVTGIPDQDKWTKQDIVVEQRDPSLVLGDHTVAGVKGRYPSFDVVPPHLISAVVTDKGVFAPNGLGRYFEGEVGVFYG